MTIQPTEDTCGPSCLHSIYKYLGLNIELQEIVNSVDRLNQGGTLGVNLGIDALRRGYDVRIFTHNLNVFDPTWFSLTSYQLKDKLKLQSITSKPYKTLLASKYYMEYLSLGGKIEFKDLNFDFLVNLISSDGPALCGLSATYLYKSSREIDETNQDDDIKGNPQGHFVILSGIDEGSRSVKLLDPLEKNPAELGSQYSVHVSHFINSLMVGVLTYDANIISIRKKL
ncbi:MAG: hypothetical protein KDD25_07800 [Bdellovibrionales bacterium]|nr:hypothetical protein [Bdellovibrionales bacterium]